MGTALTVSDNRDLQNLEENLNMLQPRFEAALGDARTLDSKRLIQTLLISCERNPKLLKCSRPSLIMGAMTFASLRLPIDGASGQGFLLPFSGVAQPCIGYRGYVTIAARSSMTIIAGTVREGDAFDYLEGSGGFVRHKRVLDNPKPIIAFWALASSKTRPDVVKVLGIGEVNAVMQRSPAVKNKADSPWKDPVIGFPAMGEKTGMRRLSRSIPYDVDDGRFLMAARMEEAFEEQGKSAWIEGRAVHVEGEPNSAIAQEQKPPPSATDLLAGRITDHEKALRAAGDAAAKNGIDALADWWKSLPSADQRAVERYKEDVLKPAAFDADPAS